MSAKARKSGKSEPAPGRRRLLKGLALVIAALLAIPAFAAFYMRHVPFTIPESADGSGKATGTGLEGGGLKVRYLGVTGYEITDGRTVIITDPMLTRPTILDLQRGPLVPDTALSKRVVPRADFILIKRRERIEPARLIHANDSTDRCVLETPTDLEPVRRIAPYAGLKVGQTVYSIGSPAGLENTLGPGLVTGLRQWQGVPIIQTNAPISPGSSGGALFDDRGNLIGITTFTVGGGGALGFAVAADSYIQAMLPEAKG